MEHCHGKTYCARSLDTHVPKSSQGIYHPGELAHGELFAYNYATSGPGAGALTTIKIVGLPNATDFHTLGLEYDEATSMLFVTNHAQAGPRIEIFKLDLDAFVATHVRTLIHPLLRIPNSIQLLHGGRELYVSNDHHFTTRDHPLLSKLETYLGPPIASIVHLALDPADSYAIKTARVVARQAFANGVALLNDTTLAAASSSGAAVHLYNIEADRALTHKAKIDVPFLPDNVEIKDDKTLLITGHPHIPTLTKFAASRHICNNPERLAAATDKEKHVCETNTGLSWASEWSEENGLRHLFVESTYGSSATTLYDTEHKFGLIAGLYAKGLFTWRD